MKSKIVLLLLFVCGFGFTQTHQATISNIQDEGLHKLLITAEVRSASKDNLDYFRILDKYKKEVPYVVFDETSQNKSLYQKLEIIAKSSIKDSINFFVIKNYQAANNGELTLSISNSEINKKYNISGSNDQKEWFGLIANQLLTNLNNQNGTSVEKMVSFPSNNYKFIKIEFDNTKFIPINILEIGYYKGERAEKVTSLLQEFHYKIIENTKDKKTLITFSADSFQKVDGISFSIATKLFSRNAKIFVNRRKEYKNKIEYYKEEISSFPLISNTSNKFQINGFFEKEFTVEIENLDNQPLAISTIELFQNTLYVIADLKSNEKYEVLIDTTLTTPQYDLAKFVQSFSKGIPNASISNLTKIDAEKENAAEIPFWQSKAFMWVCIVIGIVIIGYFAIGLIKDMKEQL